MVNIYTARKGHMIPASNFFSVYAGMMQTKIGLETLLHEGYPSSKYPQTCLGISFYLQLSSLCVISSRKGEMKSFTPR